MRLGKMKSLVFLIVFVIVTVTPSLFCWFDFHYGFLDYGGVAFIVVFTVIFNSLPSLMISLDLLHQGFDKEGV